MQMGAIVKWLEMARAQASLDLYQECDEERSQRQPEKLQQSTEPEPVGYEESKGPIPF